MDLNFVRIADAVDRPSPVFSYYPLAKFNFRALKILGEFLREFIGDPDVERAAGQYWQNPTEDIDLSGEIQIEKHEEVTWEVVNHYGEKYPEDYLIRLNMHAPTSLLHEWYGEAVEVDTRNLGPGWRSSEYASDIAWDLEQETVEKIINGPLKKEFDNFFNRVDPAIEWDWNFMQRHEFGERWFRVELYLWPKDKPKRVGALVERFAGMTAAQLKHRLAALLVHLYPPHGETDADKPRIQFRQNLERPGKIGDLVFLPPKRARAPVFEKFSVSVPEFFDKIETQRGVGVLQEGGNKLTLRRVGDEVVMSLEQPLKPHVKTSEPIFVPWEVFEKVRQQEQVKI